MKSIEAFNRAIEHTVEEIDAILKNGIPAENLKLDYFTITHANYIVGVEIKKSQKYYSFGLYYAEEVPHIEVNENAKDSPFTSVVLHDSPVLYGSGTKGVIISTCDILDFGRTKKYFKNICLHGSYESNAGNAAGIDIRNLVKGAIGYHSVLVELYLRGKNMSKNCWTILQNIKNFFNAKSDAGNPNTFQFNDYNITIAFRSNVGAFNTSAANYLPTRSPVSMQVYDSPNASRVSCYVYTADELAKEIPEVVKTSDLKDRHPDFRNIPNWVETFFKNSEHASNIGYNTRAAIKFAEPGEIKNISPQILQNFAAGFGEIASAYLIAKYPNSYFTKQMRQVLFSGQDVSRRMNPKKIKILFPASSSFKIIDWILIYDEESGYGYKIRTSVKYGQGAAPSFVGFIESCCENRTQLKDELNNNSMLKTLIEIKANSRNVNQLSVAELILNYYYRKYVNKHTTNCYFYGLRRSGFMSDEFDIFTDSYGKTGKTEIIRFKNEMRKRLHNKPITLDNLGEGAVKVFADELTAELNTNIGANDLSTLMKQLCDAMPFFQLHFDPKECVNGKLYFHKPVLVNTGIKWEISEKDSRLVIKFVTAPKRLR